MGKITEEMEMQGYHYCEKCGEIILKSEYDESIGGVVCQQCKTGA